MIRNTIATAITAAGLTATALFGATPAYADAPPSVVGDFAVEHGETICAAIRNYPTRPGMVAIADAITAEGFTMRQTGRIIGFSVVVYCPSLETTVASIMDSLAA